MTAENCFQGIRHVVHLTTDEHTICEHCDFRCNQNRIAESINHYITQHGYILLHIGTETTVGYDKPWHHTVAVLGK